MKLKAPFPYYGGKSRIAKIVWERFGKVDGYIEPFAGSLAVLLGCPYIPEREVVCDLSPHISNFWRAMKFDPDAVAESAYWPTFHHDLIAKHRWLNKWGIDNSERLLDDPEYFDAKAAGWWAWGISNWIGAEFADGWATGKQQVTDESRPQVTTYPNGQGLQVHRVRDLRPHMQATNPGWRGVNMQSLSIQDKRPTINPHCGGGGGVQIQSRRSNAGLIDEFQKLAQRLKRVIVLRRSELSIPHLFSHLCFAIRSW